MIKKLWNKICGSSNTQINSEGNLSNGEQTANKKQVVVSFRQALDLVGLPIVTFHQGNKKFNFIFDTGCTDNLIDTECLKSLKYEMLEGELHDVIGFDGKVYTLEACNISFTFEGNEYLQKYVAKDLSNTFGHIKASTGVNLHGMLGSAFCAQLKAIINYETLEICVRA